jgi:hypothetical protein
VRALTGSEGPVPSAGGDHYREMASKVRELARYPRSPGIRRELVELRSATTGVPLISTMSVGKSSCAGASS